ncbi:MAG TPA: four helix bundle protein [Anaerolineae bacterium]|nr:four helix bundle protein [Anaerolineae bacterium]
MPKIVRFEELLCWQKARVLANAIYELTERPTFSRDARLRGQIQGAAGSVMHNIAEGFDSGSKPEFIRFLKMSRRSANEVQSELYLARDCKYISEKEREAAYDLANETKQLVNGMIKHLRGKSDSV